MMSTLGRLDTEEQIRACEKKGSEPDNAEAATRSASRLSPIPVTSGVEEFVVNPIPAREHKAATESMTSAAITIWRIEISTHTSGTKHVLQQSRL